MMFWENFPWSNFHDVNLEWIIRGLKELKAYVEDKINTFETQLNTLTENLNSEIADRKKADADILQTVNNNYTALSNRITNLSNKHDTDVEKLKYLIDMAYIQSTEYTDNEIEKVKELIAKPVVSPVFNYFRQKVCTLQHTLQDYYLRLRDHAFSAGWFDAQGMTCGQLDSMGLTALEYDLQGRHRMKDFLKSWPWLAYDQENGQKVNVRHMVYNLYNRVLEGLTCGEWDAMEYTCGTFDNAGYTAYQIDWTRDPAELGG